MKKPCYNNEVRHNKPRKTTTYLKIVSHGHPLAFADGKVYEHRYVLYNKIGPNEHKCFHCNKIVIWGKNLYVDHLDNNKWNNSTDNLEPSCSRCNTNRNRWPNYKTQFPCGHERSNNSYFRPDKLGSSCIICMKKREKLYKLKKKYEKTM